MTIDEIKDISITIVDQLVQQGLIPDCTDTDLDYEFEAQDAIRLVLAAKYGIEDECL